MGHYNRDNRDGKRSGGGGFNRGFGGGKSFGGGDRFGGRDRDTRQSGHKAICSACGASCELPFKPTGERPVYCSNCFGKQQGGGDRRPQQFSNERHERPRNDFFEKKESRDDLHFGEILQQLKMLNSKIDGLVKLLLPPPSEVKPETSKKTPIESVVKEKKVKATKKTPSKKA